VEVGRAAYTAYGADDCIHHVVGDGGHRFYANDSWPTIHAEIEKL
jgi:hypothetical protein